MRRAMWGPRRRDPQKNGSRESETEIVKELKGGERQKSGGKDVLRGERLEFKNP